jgi:hypothetical protein
MPSSFPTTIQTLAPYFLRVMGRLNQHKVRLGIDPAKLAALNSLYGDVLTKGTYLYFKYLWDDNVETRTKMVRTGLSSVSKQMKKQLAAIYNDIPDSKWNIEDRKVFNRKTGLPYVKTSHVASINLDCKAHVIPGNYGLFEIKVLIPAEVRSKTEPSAANAIEMAYAIVESDIRKITDDNFHVKRECLGPDDDCLHFISLKSKFRLDLGPGFKGFDLICWFRWTNARKQSLAGHWSNRQQLMIL